MSYKSLLKKIVLSLFFILFFLIIIFTFLPTILGTQITKKISQGLKLEHFQIDIKKLGFFNTAIGKITTGQSLEIDSVNIYYSLKSLVQKKIKRIQKTNLIISNLLD